ncbi:hypothetical protein LMIY3S_00338 [Labrys miyagiensis]
MTKSSENSLSVPPSTTPDEVQSTALSTTSSPSREIAPDDSAAFLRYQYQARRRRKRLSALVLTLAFLPFVVTAIFVFFLATPLYMSESRFAIRGGDTQPTTAIGSLISPGSSGLAATGFVDGYAVRDFLQSREAMEKLEQKIDLSGMLSRHGGDFLVRVPPNPSRDRLYQAYQSLITVRYNMIEQIVVVDVQAFTPDDAVQISKALIELSDEFANGMNRRALADALKVAQEEVTRGEQRASEARLAIANWRNQNANVDPTGDVTMLTGLVGQLEAQLASAQTDLAQINAMRDPNNPRRKGAEQLVTSLRKEIEDTRKRLGGGADAVARQLTSYESLKIEQDFADSNLASARQSLNQARVAIMSQQRYVSLIAQPLVDSVPAYPSKLASLGGALLIGLALAFLGSVIGGLARNAFFR